MVQRCLVTKVFVNLNNNMYVQEFGAKLFLPELANFLWRANVLF